MTTSTYHIRPRPAVRAYVLAAGLAVAGALLAVLANANGWSAWVGVVGWVLLVSGVLLVVAAFLAGRRMQVSFALNERGYSIRDSSGERDGTWADVSRVTRSPGRLTFHGRDGQGFVLHDPARDTELLDRLAADVAGRLDQDRGYGRPGASSAGTT